MKIINLQVENIKRIKAIDITPTDNTVIIGGRNGNGKTSTMDAIAMALGGKKMIPERPIRDGEETAKIEIDLGDYLVVRHWTNPETSYLKVMTKDGGKLGNGQEILNRLVGSLSFDPLSFASMTPKLRMTTLKELTGIDFTKLDLEYDRYFEERRDVARDGKQLKAQIDLNFADLPDIPETENIEDIEKAKQEAAAHNQNITNAKISADALKNKIDMANRLLTEKRGLIQKMQDEIDLLTQEVNKSEGELDGFLCRQNSNTLIDVNVYDAKMKDYYEAKSIKDKHTARVEATQNLDAFTAEWNRYNDLITDNRNKKLELVKSADMPIKGLSFGDNEIQFNKIPFSQLSTSEQIRVSMAIAIAMNPKIRIIMINNGSLLDGDAMEEIKNIAKEKDFQVWIEKVADSSDGSCIYIEDGKIK